MIVVIIIVKHESILVYSFSYPSQFLLALDLVTVNFYTVFQFSFSYEINLLLVIVLVLVTKLIFL